MSTLLAFGVPRLDSMFADAPGQPLLIHNEPGVDTFPFLAQAARHAKAVVYLCTQRPPRRVERSLEEAGVSNVVFLDGHSMLHSIADPAYETLDPSNVADVVLHIEQAAQSHPDALFILDSLNGLAMHDLSKLVSIGPRLLHAVKNFDEAVVVFTDWHEEVALRPLLEALPHRVRLSAVQNRIVSKQYFCVERVAGRPSGGEPVLYRDDHQGLRVYVPKVVVTGPADAGKSTFVHSVCDRAVSTEQNGATVALDKGAIERKGLRVDVFGTPGQERFDPMLGPLMSHAVGIILMLDATQPASFERAAYMLRHTWRSGIHAIVAANKQDLEGALSPQEVARRLDVPDGVPVLGCTASQAASADRVMDLLLEQILSPVIT